ncbi:MAG: plastocyanin/azurin family copper-binding protein [Gemmatimonadales bacterium]
MDTQKGHRSWVAGVLVALLAAACGSGDNTAPDARPIVAKSTTKSGDLQTGIVGEALPNDLRVVVTRDGAPAADLAVTWSAASGTVDPATDQTDAEGVSTATWTLGTTPGGVTARASVLNATGSPVTFSATATTGGPTGTIVQVLTDGGTRFEPKDITVTVGTTVTWVWGTNAVSHNVIPDDGVTPATSGGLASAPHDYQYTFTSVGTFAYHCAQHGGMGGVGMSGTVTVVDAQP